MIYFFYKLVYAQTRQSIIDFAKMSSSAFCNTCFRARKSTKEYTSHNTKEKRGHNVVVVCPIILATKCAVCGGMGHWASPKYCPLIKHEERERQLKIRLQKEANEKAKKVRSHDISNNRFALLADDEEIPVRPKRVITSWSDVTSDDED